jgi:hypothetical protein
MDDVSMANNRPFALRDPVPPAASFARRKSGPSSSMAIADLGTQKFEKKGWQIPLAPRATNQCYRHQ